jgi:hypothetical protein
LRTFWFIVGALAVLVVFAALITVFQHAVLVPLIGVEAASVVCFVLSLLSGGAVALTALALYE